MPDTCYCAGLGHNDDCPFYREPIPYVAKDGSIVRPTMPDTLTKIRAAHVKATPHDFCDKDGEWWPCDTTKTLAHLDALTAAARAYMTVEDELPDVKPDDMPTTEWDVSVARYNDARAALRFILGEPREVEAVHWDGTQATWQNDAERPHDGT